MLASAAAEGALDAQEDAVRRPEAKADSIIRFEISQVEVFPCLLYNI
jgi:hypothetical protein